MATGCCPELLIMSVVRYEEYLRTFNFLDGIDTLFTYSRVPLRTRNGDGEYILYTLCLLS